MRTKARFTNMLAATTASAGALVLWVSMTGSVGAEPAVEPAPRDHDEALMASGDTCRPKLTRCRGFACDDSGVERG